MYAKLTPGGLEIAPSSILLGDRRIFNPAPEQLRDAGYLPVVTSEPPQTDDLHYPESLWVEQEGQIVQVWTVRETPDDPTPSPEERLDTMEADMKQVKSEMDDLGYILTGEVLNNAQS